jgi:glyoxylase-like metal-dependent hydrolase (beta-lactamase superfamily II)
VDVIGRLTVSEIRRICGVGLGVGVTYRLFGRGHSVRTDRPLTCVIVSDGVPATDRSSVSADGVDRRGPHGVTRLPQDTFGIQDALAVTVAAGIFPLVLPTPFGVGPVNTYLIEDDPLTLVDCGPNSATALEVLEDELRARGHALSDLELVIVTHQHADHAGLAHAIVRRSGAELATLDLLAPVIAHWRAHAQRDDDDARLLMVRHGVEDDVAEAIHAVAKVTQFWGESAEVDRILTAGGELALADRRFRILHRPGHSPSDTVLYDAERRIMIAGDHLLASVSSNALVSRPLTTWDGSRPKPLIQYRASLAATRSLDAAVTLGGHGAPVIEHRALIDSRLLEQERRAAALLAHLQGGPRTAHQLAESLFGKSAITQIFLTMSEVLGHLDLLVEQAAIVEDRSGHVIRFSPA